MTTLREAYAADLDAVAALDALLFEDDPWDRAAWEGLVGTAGRRLLVALREERVVGYALTGVAGDFADLLRIGTDPRQRRLGVATRLLEELSRAAVDDGAERLLLEVSRTNTGARAFYAAAGFVEIDRRPGYYRDGSTALVLERALPAPERMDP